MMCHPLKYSDHAIAAMEALMAIAASVRDVFVLPVM